MTFDETLDVMRGLVGRQVEVSVGTPRSDGELDIVAGFSGVPSEVKRGGPRAGERWYVWFPRDGGDPLAHHITLDRALFEDAEVEASGMSLEDVVAEEAGDGPRGTTWALKVRQASVVTDILIYV